MKLGKVILKNEKLGKALDNHKIVRAKLKELINKETQRIVDLLHSLNIKASIVAPKAVLYSTVVKHVALNSDLRAAISELLLGEQNGEFHNANGQGLTIAGGAMQAIGSVLTGIGRNQAMTMGVGTMTDPATLKMLEEERRREREEEERRRRTNLAIGLTVGIMILIGIILTIRHLAKGKAKPVAKKAASVASLNK